MSVLRRGVIFTIGTVSNAILFIFHSRVLLEVLAQGNEIAGTGPATGAMELLPVAMQLAMGILQIGLIVYLLGGLGEERAAQQRPLP
jgi:hypothetical protein